jgi:ketosteroid isomerase-like protein
MTPSKNEQIVRDLYDAFARRDNEAIRGLMAPEIEWVQMPGFPNGGTYVGADAIFEGVFSGFRKDWKEWKAVVTEWLDAGPDIIAIGYYAGIHGSTARSCHAGFAHRYTVRNGLILRFEQYTDTRAVAEAMGVSGKP